MSEWIAAFDRQLAENMLLQIGTIILVVKAAGLLSRRFKQPAVFGQLMAGIILGPSLLKLLSTTPLINGMAEIGVVLLMFLAGMETDIKKIAENGGASVLSALGGIILPLAGGIGLGVAFGLSLKVAIFLGVTLTATSVSITVQTLRELGKLQTREGTTILGAAVLDDILGIIMLSILLGILAGAESDDLAFLILKILLFLIATWMLGRALVPAGFRLVRNLGVSQGLVPLGLAFCFALAYLSQLGGLASITGAYLAGLLLKESGYANIMYESVETLSNNIFIPVFLVNIGLSAQIADLGSSLSFVGLLVLVAIFTKLLGGAIGAKLAGFPVFSSLAVGAGLVSRGEIALIIAALGLSKGIIDNSMFVSLVVMVLMTTVLSPVLLKKVFQGNK